MNKFTSDIHFLNLPFFLPFFHTGTHPHTRAGRSVLFFALLKPNHYAFSFPDPQIT